MVWVLQPAEVLGLVDIPSHIRFWGIDSGLRHRYHKYHSLSGYSCNKYLHTCNLNIFYAPHIWKLCSIGGADYGSVRIGAFMGREMIKSTASNKLTKALSVANGTHTDESEESAEPLEAEKSLEYLCNLSPHRL